MGIEIRPELGSETPYVGIPFVAQGESEIESGVWIPLDTELHATSVFYKPNLPSLVIQSIQVLGLNFITLIEDYMVDSAYEAVIIFTSFLDYFKHLFVPDNPMDQFKKNTQNQTFRKAILENRYLLERNGIDVQELLRQLEDFKNQCSK
jgi:hypothetical protein